MAAVVRKLGAGEGYAEVIREAAACIADGGLVVFPTETVYGIGANVLHERAMRRLRNLKDRPAEKPFSVHIGSRAAVEQFVPGLAGTARRLTQKAWPGPLTVIFDVPDPASAAVIQSSSTAHIDAMYHEGTIGIRCPDDRAAMDLLNQAAVPVVAASANPAGGPAPVDGEEALAAIGAKVDLVVDAGRTRYAKPSTIVKVNADGYEVIREGVMDARTIKRLMRTNFLLVCSGNTCRSPMGEGILRRLLAERLGCRDDELNERGYAVESAGTGAFEGAPATEPAVAVMRARGIDISRHRSQPLTTELLHRADFVFAMTGGHLAMIRRMGPGLDSRARALADEDIEDPIGADESVYQRCANRIEECLRHHLQEIKL